MNLDDKIAEEHLVLETAMEAGNILLENGAEIFRVEETMERICRAFGVSESNFFVLSNGIFTTGSTMERPYAKVKHIPVRAADLERVVEVNALSRRIAEGKCDLKQARAELKRIREMPEKKKIYQIAASGIGSASFCVLFGGTLWDSVAALIVGLLLYVFVLFVWGKYLSKLTGNLAGGILVALASIACVAIGIGNDLSHIIIGGIIPLVPGIAFTNGIRDIAEGDYISGAVRLLDACLVFLCIAMGVGFTLMLRQRMGGGFGL